MKDILISGIKIIGGLLFAFLEVSGVYHAAVDHGSGDAAIAFFIPPYAWYRSIESYYHQSELDNFTNQELSYDMEFCVYYLNEGISGASEPEEIQLGAIRYSQTISRYSEEKRQKLKTTVDSYISYQIAFDEALVASLRASKSLEAFRFEKTEQLNAAEQHMNKQRLYSLVLPQKELDIISSNVNASINRLGYTSMSETLEAFVEQIQLQSKLTLMNYLSIYEVLFGDTYSMHDE